MFASIIFLSIAYAVLAILLLNIGFFSRIALGWKLGLCVLTGCFLFVHFTTLRDLLGWPTHTPLPPKFLLLAAEINEPDKETGDPGNIYVWATEIVDRTPVSTPRAYEVEYNKGLHEKLNLAKTGQRKGIPQIGEVPDRPVTLFSLKTTSSLTEEIEIYALPDPVLPEK